MGASAVTEIVRSSITLTPEISEAFPSSLSLTPTMSPRKTLTVGASVAGSVARSIDHFTSFGSHGPAIVELYVVPEVKGIG